MGFFADSLGLVLSRKMSVTFNHFDFFPAAQFLQSVDINRRPSPIEKQTYAAKCAVKRRLN